MTIFGWDASDFDWSRGPMDVGRAARDGIAFFTHKATEGTRTKHIHYGEALTRARAAGIPFLGAYVVVRTPGNNGHGTVSAQVDYFLSYLDLHTPWWRSHPGFFLQVDLEHWGYDDVPPQVGVQACSLLRQRTGKWVVLYAPRWAYGDTIGGDDPLWASSYGGNPAVPYRNGYPGDDSAAWRPYSGRVPVFAQYGSRLTIGTQPGCDANAFRGSIEALRAMITGGDDMAGEADKAFSAAYTGTEGWVSGQSWMAQAVESPLNEINRKVTDLAKNVAGVSDAQLAALEARLAAKIPTAEQIVAALVAQAAK